MIVRTINSHLPGLRNVLGVSRVIKASTLC
jgi:hypothetical protein